MADNKARVTELAELMDEFRLSEARLASEEVTIAFRRKSAPVMRSADMVMVEAEQEGGHYEEAPGAAVPEPPKGTPISSPMTGIYYTSPSPSSPVFVKEGDVVTAGQIVGLIEAMKVFNEIPSPLSGTVLKVVATSGQLVQPGEALILIG